MENVNVNQNIIMMNLLNAYLVTQIKACCRHLVIVKTVVMANGRHQNSVMMVIKSIGMDALIAK